MHIKNLRNWLACLDNSLPELYLVGGTVRDMLLNHCAKDLDLVCKGAKEFASDLAQGKSAALVPMEKKPGEPCYRVVDRENSGNFLDIAEMRGETINEDLERRDFTINAMAMRVLDNGVVGETIDPLNGIRDLEKRIIKMAGEGSLASDPLRILRAFRFSAKLDFTIDPETLDAMKSRAALLQEVSPERILSELLMILRTPQSVHHFKNMDRCGIVEIIFPEIIQMKGCSQNSYHHKDVWEHSLLVMENCEHIISDLAGFFSEFGKQAAANLLVNNRLPLLKLAAMLHDVGKPATRKVDKDTERIAFLGHEAAGAIMAEKIAERLRMPTKDRDFLSLLVVEHLHVLNLSNSEVKPKTIMKWFRKMKDDAIPAIILGMADIKGTLGVGSSEEGRDKCIAWSKEAVMEYYSSIKKRLERMPLVTGKDLIELGMKPGPEMGQVLRKITEAQDGEQVTNRDEALEMAIWQVFKSD